MRKFCMTAVIAAVWLGDAVMARATLVDYTVEGAGPQQFPGPLTPPGDAPWGPNGYPGDTLELTTYTGSFDLVLGTSIQKLNTLLWTIDYTYGGSPEPWPDLNTAVSVKRKMAIDGGVAQVLNQAGNLRVNYDNDFLSISDGATLTFLVQGYRVDVTPLGIAEVEGSNFTGANPWPQPELDLLARFDVSLAAVPEPTTLLSGGLLLLPLGARLLRPRQLG